MHGTQTPDSRPEVRLVAVLLTGLLVWLLSAPLSAQQPRTGGTLTFIVSAEPPSFDAHREATFALIHSATRRSFRIWPRAGRSHPMGRRTRSRSAGACASMTGAS